MNAPARQASSFWEEMAEAFRFPVMILLGLVALAFIGCGTWVTATLLDRVLTAFSQAAATKSSLLGSLSLRDLVAGLFWLCALGLVARQALPAGGLRTLSVPVLALAIGGAVYAAPSIFANVPLYVPIGVLVAAWLFFVCTQTRVPAITRRELANVMMNPLGYVVLTVFTVVLAILFVSAVEQLLTASPTSELNLAPLQALFGTGNTESRDLNFLVIALLLIVPVITMRLLAEEKRSGTEEVLLTTPVREWHIVTGKFAGTMVFFLLLWTLALVPILLLSQRGTLDLWQVGSSLLGMGIIGFGLIGIGVLASSLTRNQLAAAVLTFLGLLVFTFPSFAALPAAEGNLAILRSAGEYLDLRRHLAWVARGTIDSRTVFLFLSVGMFSLFLSVRALETRRWAGFGLWRAMGPFRGLLGIAGLVALVCGVIWIANLTGRQQVKLRKAEVAAETTARAKERAAAEAAIARTDQTRKSEVLDTKRPTIEGGDEPIKAAEPAPDESAPKPDATAPAGAPDTPANEPPSAPSTAPDGAKPEGGTTDSGTPDAAATVAPRIEAEWTPARLLKVIGAALIGLIAFLIVFARVVSAGLRNQIVFGSNVMVASLAAATLVLLTNYLATRNHKAIDLTESGAYSLAPNILEALDNALPEGETVDLIALVGRYPSPSNRAEVDDNVRRDTLERAFEKFAEALNRPGVQRFDYTFIDPKTESDKAKQTLSEFNTSGRRQVILRYRDRYEVLDDDALFKMDVHPGRMDAFLQQWRKALERGDWWPPMPKSRAQAELVANHLVRERGNPDYLKAVTPRRNVEQRVADAMIQLVTSPGNNLYYTVGHGEKTLDPRPSAADLTLRFGDASLFRRTLVRQNFNLTPLAPLTGDRAIPERANFIVIAAPTTPFAAEEIEKLKSFVAKGGNLMIFTEASQDGGLAPLLSEYGLQIDKSQLWMGTSPRGMSPMRGPRIIPRSPYVIVSEFKGEHEVLRALKSSNPPDRRTRPYPSAVFVLPSPIQGTPERARLKDRFRTTTVMKATREQIPREGTLVPWAESTLDAERPQYDPGEKLGDFDIGVLVEPAKDDQVGGKVLVISDSDFIEDRLRLPGMQDPGDVSPYGVYENDDIMEKVLQYLKKRRSTIEGEVKAPRGFRFQAGNQLEFAAWKNNAKWLLWGALPAFFILCGMFVFYVRRRA